MKVHSPIKAIIQSQNFKYLTYLSDFPKLCTIILLLFITFIFELPQS